MANEFDPNDPSTYQLVKVRLLTPEEEIALQVFSVTLEQTIGQFVDRELPRYIVIAKRTLTKEKTLTELKTVLEAEKIG